MTSITIEPHKCPNPDCERVKPPRAEKTPTLVQNMWWQVRCSSCACRGPTAATEEEAVRLWNGLCSHEWQPIETAPKDHELFGWIPTWYGKGGHCVIVWFDNKWMPADHHMREVKPSHWMELPLAPMTPEIRRGEGEQHE